MKEKEYWNQRYRNGETSGYGSYGEQLIKKLGWIVPLNFRTITEVGCGDFHFANSLLQIKPSIYTGLDISDVIVAKNRGTYPKHTFKIYNGEIPPADLVMCVDVLFHILDDQDVEELLNNLEKAWTKYLVITAYERDEDKDNHVRIRKFDYKRFGEPIIREIVEEDGSLYFYVWQK